MRHIRLLIIVFIIIVFSCGITSCNKTTSCSDPKYCELQFYTTSQTDTIKDISGKIMEYIKGNNLATVVDSFVFDSLVSLNVVGQNSFSQLYISFSDHSADIYNYDWKIILLPSGRTYTLTKVSHDNRTIRQSNENNLACINDITYMANDSLCQMPGGGNSTGPTGG